MNEQMFFMDDSYLNSSSENNLNIKFNTITNELLLKNGFELKFDNIIEEEYYEITANSKNIKNYTFYITVNKYSNMINRNWNVHIDSNDRSTVGSMNVETTEHFNKLMDLLDIDYKMIYF